MVTITNNPNTRSGVEIPPRHEQVSLTHHDGVEIHVDAHIARFISDIWARDIITYSSCEGVYIPIEFSENGHYVRNLKTIDRNRAFVVIEASDDARDLISDLLRVAEENDRIEISLLSTPLWGSVYRIRFSAAPTVLSRLRWDLA